MNHFGWNGLKYWVSSAKGHEKIGAGIRPYGLHAGNLASVVAYPSLICELFRESRKKQPCFTYQVWLNDVEPVKYVGADGRPETANEANMYPGSTTFQFTPAPDDFKGSLTDYWQPVIESVVQKYIGKRFPSVTLEFHRASELIQTNEFRKAAFFGIMHSDKVTKNIQRNTGHFVRGVDGILWPLHPDSHTPITEDITYGLSLRGLAVSVPKQGSRFRLKRPAKKFDWAMQFRALQAIRLAAEQPDLWVMGVDHIKTNQSFMLEHLARSFRIPKYKGEFLHVPLILADNSKKMSKSLGNTAYIDPQTLINALRQNTNESLNIQNAFTSKDILALNVPDLPEHVSRKRKKRVKALSAARSAYLKSGKDARFKKDNGPNKSRERMVSNMLGIAHL